MGRRGEAGATAAAAAAVTQTATSTQQPKQQQQQKRLPYFGQIIEQHDVPIYFFLLGFVVTGAVSNSRSKPANTCTKNRAILQGQSGKHGTDRADRAKSGTHHARIPP